MDITGIIGFGAFTVPAAPGGLYTPDSVSNLFSWWDPSDAATITLGSGNDVTQLADKSGNGYHATAGSNYPQTGGAINSRNALSYNGTSHRLVIPAGWRSLSNGDCTVIGVAKSANASATNQHIFCGTSGLNRFRVEPNRSSTGNVTGTCGTANAVKTVTFDTNIHAYVLRVSGSTAEIFYDGGTATTAAAVAFTMSDSVIGAFGNGTSDFWNGTIGPLFSYSRALTNTEVNGLGNDYCAGVWGSSWSNI
jgi:hypothetical protein